MVTSKRYAVFSEHVRDEVSSSGLKSNVLVNEQREGVLSDFGIASLANEKTGLTSTGGFKGSLRWASLEQLNSPERLNNYTSDVWQFGMTALEVISLRFA